MKYFKYQTFHLQGSYSPNGAISEMYGSIGGHYSSHYGNLNFSGANTTYNQSTTNPAPWRGSQHYIHWKYFFKIYKEKIVLFVRTYYLDLFVGNKLKIVGI